MGRTADLESQESRPQFAMPSTISIRVWIAPAVLIAIACTHLFRTYAYDQSSWGAGCGFGMFAKVDHHGARFFRCYILTDDGEVPAEIPEHVSPRHIRIRVIPTTEELQVFADELAHARWVHEENGDQQDLSVLVLQEQVEKGDVQAVKVRQLRLELWTLRFDQARKQVEALHMMSAVESPAEVQQYAVVR